RFSFSRRSEFFECWRLFRLTVSLFHGRLNLDFIAFFDWRAPLGGAAVGGHVIACVRGSISFLLLLDQARLALALFMLLLEFAKLGLDAVGLSGREEAGVALDLFLKQLLCLLEHVFARNAKLLGQIVNADRYWLVP